MEIATEWKRETRKRKKRYADVVDGNKQAERSGKNVCVREHTPRFALRSTKIPTYTENTGTGYTCTHSHTHTRYTGKLCT